CARRHETYDCW
nr:immunoglobulin heavy chain junction region [Macaca mulatta]